MYFADLHERLLDHIRSLLDRGETTERRLARQAGLSQSHLHNVLKGARGLSNHLADRLLRHLDLSVVDLLSPEERNSTLGRRQIPPPREPAQTRRRDSLATSR
ncbi:MAG: helix-turn-helix transcriptional regulator [Bryobacterales bacterium]|nr:helix-turn-helix domain-containing protein [Bryobacteraceae bacterium]MDW8129349.1 helix-turn-helix transcriptional regulator [Bryobacterales bacterium]